jgi:hypothetical protein
MSGRSFRSVFMVASCAGAALGCYLVSLNVASERASLEDVENRIVLAQRDIRLLQTEIGTRGRLAQLERWNVKVIQLSAPTADQFLEGGFQLARLGRPEQKTVDAPVVFASAPAPSSPSAPLEEGERPDNGAGVTPSAGPAQLVHQASLKLPPRVQIPVRAIPAPAAKAVAQKTEAPRKTVVDKATKPVAAKPALLASKSLPPATKLASTPVKKAGDNKAKAEAKPVTKTVRTAKVDPLAPLLKPKDSAKAR